MSYTKSSGFNVSLGIDTSGGTNYTTQSRVYDGFKGQEAKADTADTTFLGDTWKSFLPTNKDGGEIKLEIGLDFADSSGSGGSYGSLATAFATNALCGCKYTITYPAGGTSSETFQAYIVGLGRTMEKNKFNVCPITLKITNDPGFGGA